MRLIAENHMLIIGILIAGFLVAANLWLAAERKSKRFYKWAQDSDSTIRDQIAKMSVKDHEIRALKFENESRKIVPAPTYRFRKEIEPTFTPYLNILKFEAERAAEPLIDLMYKSMEIRQDRHGNRVIDFEYIFQILPNGKADI